MTEAVFDFEDINRRLNRKPEVVATVEAPFSPIASWWAAAAAAPLLIPDLRTDPRLLQKLYQAGADAMNGAHLTKKQMKEQRALLNPNSGGD